MPSPIAMLWLLLATATAQDLGGYFSPGPLAAAHEDLSGVTSCVSCHKPGAGVDSTRCLACHDEVRAQVDGAHGFHADKAEHCERCHSDHKGRDYAMIPQVEPSDFDHSSTDFALAGGHDDVPCADCHEQADSGHFTGADTACADCHDEVHGAAASSHDVLDTCTSCHDNGSWSAAIRMATVFLHEAPSQADFPLEGAHADVPCVDCHPKARFLPTEHDRCTDCHRNPHRAPLGPDCARCHSPTGWQVRAFDHGLTGFALQGMHAEARCASCHHGHATRALPHEACADCHADPHEGRFADKPCATCHDVFTAGFAVGDFDHARTGFPLTGGHAEVACDTCHGEDRAQNELGGASCDTCHTDPHQGRFQPTPCSSCHTSAGWGQGDFDHGITGWPLEGAHGALPCETCHANGQFAGLTRDSCADCHAEHPHGPTADRAGCASCHQVRTWSEIRFDHGTTGFALAPQHTQRSCRDCHTDLAGFPAPGTDCLDCHGDRKPALHYKGSCGDCHTAAHWIPATLGDRSHAETGFPLRGTHARLACTDCHSASGPRGATPDGCADCHEDTDPHRGQLSRDCSSCHGPTQWFAVRFRHVQTGWPLRGPHKLAACEDCHAVGYIGTPTDCWRCHEADAPPSIGAHRSAAFPFCEECHSPYTWSAAIPHRVIK